MSAFLRLVLPPNFGHMFRHLIAFYLLWAVAIALAYYATITAAAILKLPYWTQWAWVILVVFGRFELGRARYVAEVHVHEPGKIS